MISTPFQRLIRFEDSEGRVHYGEVGDRWQESPEGQNVRVFENSNDDIFTKDLKLSDKQVKVAKLLCPLPSVPIVIGIGLNYRKHAEEAGFPIPKYPVVFTKYAASLAGPYEDIPIDPVAEQLDYEGELSVVMGKDTKNIPESEDPLDYVLGYTVGNDVSSRYWQNAERSAGQHGYAKSFDKFAPIGPVIASPKAVGNPEKLTLKTWVNGEVRQDGATDDLIFDLRAIIRHLSQGMTLKKGTVIMTGTPSGVAAFMKPAAWLKHDDVVEIEIENIGRIKNRMVFEK